MCTEKFVGPFLLRKCPLWTVSKELMRKLETLVVCFFKKNCEDNMGREEKLMCYKVTCENQMKKQTKVIYGHNYRRHGIEKSPLCGRTFCCS